MNAALDTLADLGAFCLLIGTPFNDEFARLYRTRRLQRGFGVETTLGPGAITLGGGGTGTDYLYWRDLVGVYDVATPKLAARLLIKAIRPLGELVWNGHFHSFETSKKGIARELDVLEKIYAAGIPTYEPCPSLSRPKMMVRRAIPELESLVIRYGAVDAEEKSALAQKSGILLKQIHELIGPHGDASPVIFSVDNEDVLYLDHLNFCVNPQMPHELALAKDLKTLIYTTTCWSKLPPGEVSKEVLEGYLPSQAVEERLKTEFERDYVFADSHPVMAFVKGITFTSWVYGHWTPREMKHIAQEARDVIGA